MRRFLLEEAYELIHAVDGADYENLREELGDLLFILFFYAQLAEEEQRFDLDQAAAECAQKLIRRHPHVFGDVQVSGVEEILSNWDAIKAGEKGGPGGRPQDLQEWLPALLRAEEAQKKAAKIGFDWPDAAGPLAKVREECAEVEDQMQADGARLEEEIGDLIFSCVNLARKLKVNPELALHRSTRKFQDRLQAVRELAATRGLQWSELDAAALEQLWNEICGKTLPD